MVCAAYGQTGYAANVRGPIHHLLTHDHARLDALLARSTANPEVVDLAAYQELRAGLLRHIAMEEKVLFVDARMRRGGVPLPITKQLHADHAALASLLVPSPTHALIGSLREILDEHNHLEEEADGLYDLCEQLAGAELDAVLARMHAIPAVRVSQHVDEPRIHAHIERMLAARAIR